MVRLLLLGCVVLGACAAPHGVLLTAQELEQSGTHQVAAPPAQVFSAAVGALQSMGYAIAFQDQASGLVKTGRKVVRTVFRSGEGEVPISRQYALSLSARGSGTLVVATPYVFIGERDVSQEPMWDLDGADGERALWKALFKEIEALGSTAPLPAPPL